MDYVRSGGQTYPYATEITELDPVSFRLRSETVLTLHLNWQVLKKGQ